MRSGVMFDAPRRAVRVIEGVAGAAHLGAEVLGGVEAAWVSPSGKAAVVRGSGGWALVRGLGSERVIYEETSRNTAENAAHSYQLVKPKPGEVWVLVTSASHLPRAMRCFEKAGWKVIPYPCDFAAAPGTWFRDGSIGDALRRLSRAAREWVGMAVYALFGKV
ncbi:MAG: YdcF family protein [Nitrososphaerota archaeon]